MRYSFEPKDRTYVKELSFTKNISKILSNKYGQKHLDSGKKCNNAIKNASKRAIQKTVEATGDLTGNKISDKITNVPKSLLRNCTYKMRMN